MEQNDKDPQNSFIEVWNHKTLTFDKVYLEYPDSKGYTTKQKLTPYEEYPDKAPKPAYPTESFFSNLNTPNPSTDLLKPKESKSQHSSETSYNYTFNLADEKKPTVLSPISQETYRTKETLSPINQSYPEIAIPSNDLKDLTSLVDGYISFDPHPSIESKRDKSISNPSIMSFPLISMIETPLFSEVEKDKYVSQMVKKAQEQIREEVTKAIGELTKYYKKDSYLKNEVIDKVYNEIIPGITERAKLLIQSKLDDRFEKEINRITSTKSSYFDKKMNETISNLRYEFKTSMESRIAGHLDDEINEMRKKFDLFLEELKSEYLNSPEIRYSLEQNLTEHIINDKDYLPSIKTDITKYVKAEIQPFIGTEKDRISLKFNDLERGAEEKINALATAINKRIVETTTSYLDKNVPQLINNAVHKEFKDFKENKVKVLFEELIAETSSNIKSLTSKVGNLEHQRKEITDLFNTSFNNAAKEFEHKFQNFEIGIKGRLESQVKELCNNSMPKLKMLYPYILKCNDINDLFNKIKGATFPYSIVYAKKCKNKNDKDIIRIWFLDKLSGAISTVEDLQRILNTNLENFFYDFEVYDFKTIRGYGKTHDIIPYIIKNIIEYNNSLPEKKEKNYYDSIEIVHLINKFNDLADEGSYKSQVNMGDVTNSRNHMGKSISKKIMGKEYDSKNEEHTKRFIEIFEARATGFTMYVPRIYQFVINDIDSMLL